MGRVGRVGGENGGRTLSDWRGSALAGRPDHLFRSESTVTRFAAFCGGIGSLWPPAVGSLRRQPHVTDVTDATHSTHSTDATRATDATPL
jgi:hypothetical protein